MIIDETFMWLYWLHKAGYACHSLSVFFIMVTFVAAGVGGVTFFVGRGGHDEDAERIGRFLLHKLYFFIPLEMFFLLATSFAPSNDELKAYAAYRIGEKVVTSNEAKRMMDAALLYLEGKAKGE